VRSRGFAWEEIEDQERLLDRVVDVFARAFNIADPLIQHTPIIDLKTARRSNLDEIKIPASLERNGRRRQAVGALIVAGKVTPQRNRHPVSALPCNHRFKSFSFVHGSPV